MSKVTSKLQVTIPKAVAMRYGIRPGDQVRWEELPRGVVMIRVAADGEGRVSEGRATRGLLTARDLSPEERLAIFDGQTRRLRELQGGRRWKRAKDRGWTREELYHDRGLPR